ncbi:hypothetical protein DC522_08415 [Microvirga sp. KLBC 81]|uniref:extracellular solute-binding protein n=1 Tax=Microvirga sp. KLBC 81 TaxID=1862707 RepID=UPI000D5139DF|nr:extracellular solute-binding protein [Microvirga sp. KLBC 81]PVE24933.1 hypothetical protein DC522_08415 [Microvirga sp. KLBC 81]
MTTIRLRGLAWGHRRATGPLAPLTKAFQNGRPDVEIEWVVRPLSDFEHQPIRDIAAQNDLLIVDHPFCGDVAAAHAFMALDEALPDLLGPQADALYVGPSLPSYRFAGHVWAAPIDAATPHAVARADLLEQAGEALPKNWAETVALGRRLRAKGLYLATPVPTPHAFATVASLMANLGKPISTDPAGSCEFDHAAMTEALEALDDVLAFSHPETLKWNSIDLHEAMVARDDIAFTPCVYGYATYAEADMRAPLTFSDFCGLRTPYEAGSMLGGTGLAVSASSRHPEAALAFVRFALSRTAQDRIIPEHHGQPALVTSWEDPDNNARFNGFYSGVRRSMETAWIRPRQAGYIRFQAAAGAAMERYCARELSKAQTIDQVASAARQIFTQAAA